MNFLILNHFYFFWTISKVFTFLFFRKMSPGPVLDFMGHVFLVGIYLPAWRLSRLEIYGSMKSQVQKHGSRRPWRPKNSLSLAQFRICAIGWKLKSSKSKFKIIILSSTEFCFCWDEFWKLFLQVLTGMVIKVNEFFWK